jgi:hypothetical protein
MSEQLDLHMKFDSFMNQNLKQIIEKGESEAVFNLYTSDWVRILLVRSLEEINSSVIDVEVSLPFRSSFSTIASNNHINRPANDAKHTLESMIEHIKYVLTLEASGFSVDVVDDGCLLIAYCSFVDKPDAEIFRLLQPPIA